MSRSTQTEQMKALVGSFHRSGQSRKEFSKAHGLTESKLQYWIKKFSEKPMETAGVPPSFIPLHVPPEGAPSAPRSIVVRTPDGVEVHVPI